MRAFNNLVKFLQLNLPMYNIFFLDCWCLICCLLIYKLIFCFLFCLIYILQKLVMWKSWYRRPNNNFQNTNVTVWHISWWYLHCVVNAFEMLPCLLPSVAGHLFFSKLVCSYEEPSCIWPLSSDITKETAELNTRMYIRDRKSCVPVLQLQRQQWQTLNWNGVGCYSSKNLKFCSCESRAPRSNGILCPKCAP